MVINVHFREISKCWKIHVREARCCSGRGDLPGRPRRDWARQQRRPHVHRLLEVRNLKHRKCFCLLIES